jgi:hypothetical protein
MFTLTLERDGRQTEIGKAETLAEAVRIVEKLDERFARFESAGFPEKPSKRFPADDPVRELEGADFVATDAEGRRYLYSDGFDLID